MGGGGERVGVADLGQDAGSGPDCDPGHGGRDLRERVGLQQGGDPHLQVLPAFEEDREGLGQAGGDLPCRACAGTVTVRSVRAVVIWSEGVPPLRISGAAWNVTCVICFGTGMGELGWGTEGLKQGQDGRVPQAGPRTRSRAGWMEVSRPRCGWLCGWRSGRGRRRMPGPWSARPVVSNSITDTNGDQATTWPTLDWLPLLLLQTTPQTHHVDTVLERIGSHCRPFALLSTRARCG